MRYLLFALALLFMSMAPAAGQPIAQMPQTVTTAVTSNRPVLKQKQEPWRFVSLGGPLWVSKHGCAVFALRDALADLGYDDEPLAFIDKLKAARMLPGGLLELGGVDRLYSELSSARLYPSDELSVQKAVELTKLGARVLLRFNDGHGVHWVYLSPRPGSDGSLMVRDSRFGTSLPVDIYAKSQKLDGMVVITKKDPLRLAAK